MAIDLATMTESSFGEFRQNLNDNFDAISEEFEDVRHEIAANIIFGTYTGDGSAVRTINLEATPIAVEVYTEDGFQGDGTGYSYFHGGLAIRNNPCKSHSSYVLEVVNNGFKVFYDYGTHICTNSNGTKYYYKAYMSGDINA